MEQMLYKLGNEFLQPPLLCMAYWLWSLTPCTKQALLPLCLIRNENRLAEFPIFDSKLKCCAAILRKHISHGFPSVLTVWVKRIRKLQHVDLQQVYGEVKINEARGDSFFDHYVTMWGQFFEVTLIWYFGIFRKSSLRCNPVNSPHTILRNQKLKVCHFKLILNS